MRKGSSTTSDDRTGTRSSWATGASTPGRQLRRERWMRRRRPAVRVARGTARAAIGPRIVAFWHQPRFSSGSEHGSDEAVAGLWTLLQRAGADLVLNGHEHHYERFVPKTPPSPSPGGIVEIVVGTGGNTHVYPFGEPLPTSAMRLEELGVLELGLLEDAWLAAIRRRRAVRSPTELEAIADPPHQSPRASPSAPASRLRTRATFFARDGFTRSVPSSPSSEVGATARRRVRLLRVLRRELEQGVERADVFVDVGAGSPISRSRSGTVQQGTAGATSATRAAPTRASGIGRIEYALDRAIAGVLVVVEEDAGALLLPPRSWRRPACAVRSPARMRGPPGACS